jgi:hypothetical protein
MTDKTTLEAAEKKAADSKSVVDAAKTVETDAKAKSKAAADALKTAKAHTAEMTKGLKAVPDTEEHKATRDQWVAAETAAKEAEAAAEKAASEAKAEATSATEALKAAKEAAKTARAELTEAKKKPKVERQKQNDVTRPLAGTKTGAVWDKADEMSADLKRPVLLGELKTALPEINDGTVSTQYNHWCTFNGVTAEQRKAARDAIKEAAKPAPADPAPAPAEG